MKSGKLTGDLVLGAVSVFAMGNRPKEMLAGEPSVVGRSIPSVHSMVKASVRMAMSFLVSN